MRVGARCAYEARPVLAGFYISWVVDMSNAIAEIDVALHYAVETLKEIDQAKRQKIIEFINDLLDARNDAIVNTRGKR